MAVQWALTAVFVCTGMYMLVRTGSPAHWIHRVSRAGHVLMCLAMAAMPWLPAGPGQSAAMVVAFTAAGIWYLVLARIRPTAAAGSPSVDSARHAFPGVWHHAAMMFGMVWMTALMAYLPAGHVHAGGTQAGATTEGVRLTGPHDGHHGGGDVLKLPTGGSSPATAMQHGQQPSWATAITLAFTGAFLAAAGWFLGDAARTWHRSRRLTTTADAPRDADDGSGTEDRVHDRTGDGPGAAVWDGLAHGLMAAGMAASFLSM